MAELTPEQQKRKREAELARAKVEEILVSLGATEEQRALLRPYFNEHGSVTQIPMQRNKRAALLDLLAQRFEPGKIYPEANVNLILGQFNKDWAALRRYLVDDEFLERRDSFYWRAGGTFEI